MIHYRLDIVTDTNPEGPNLKESLHIGYCNRY